jgi:hypothetical protein
MILASILISFSIGLVSDGSLIGLEKERRVKHPPPDRRTSVRDHQGVEGR